MPCQSPKFAQCAADLLPDERGLRRTKPGEPMIKLIATIHRKPGLSDEAFLRHWREIHVPLVARLPNLKGYVINPFLDTMDEVRPYDGIAELWFEDRAAFDRSMASPERDAARADLAEFTDLARMTRAIVDEERIL